jgi:hypothetical protein
MGESRRPRRIVAAALAVGALAALMTACSGGSSTPPTSTTRRTTTTSSSTTTTEAPGVPVDAISLAVGQCFDERVTQGQGLAKPQQIIRIDCSLAHDNEIYFSTSMPDAIGAPYPGPDHITAFANKQCYAAFKGFVGKQYELSKYAIGYLTPTEQSWGYPDRRVLCFVFDRTGKKLTGSARATKK